MLTFLLVVFVISNAVSFFVLLQIRDEIEVGLPIKDRESWRPWGVRRFPRKEFRLHRDKFPSSRLRMLWILSTLVSLGCLIGLVVGAVLGSSAHQAGALPKSLIFSVSPPRSAD